MPDIVSHIQETKPSYIREVLKAAKDNNVISLAGGLPCPELLPMPIIKEVLPKLTKDISLFQYGSTSGYQPLCEYLRLRYEVPDSHEILITSGSQQGIYLCARAFIDRSEKIVVEDPSYLGALQIFSMTQATILSVDHENDGPNIEQLEVLFSNNDIVLFYAVPDFQNPTGCCWSMRKRYEVARLCHQYNVLLIEDAPYRELRFTGVELPTVSCLLPNNSVLLKSFSKSISPGMRVAALITPKRWSKTLNKVKQALDLHTNSPMQKLTLEILSHPDFETHLETINQQYKLRYQTLAVELSSLPLDQYSYERVEGGMFVWLSIPDCDTLALAGTALQNGVAIVPGSEFFVTNRKRTSKLRLNFSYNKPDIIHQAMDRLKPILEFYKANAKES